MRGGIAGDTGAAGAFDVDFPVVDGRDGVIRLTAATTATANGVLLDLAAGKLHEIPVVLAAATIPA